MPLTEAQLNALLIARGMEFRFSCRGDLTEKLGLYPGSDGSAGAGAAYTTAGPENAATGNVLTCSGAANSYAQYVELPDGSRVLGEFWARFSTLMLAKCAESLALSRAFVPCNGLYLAEEMQFVPQRKKFVPSTPVAEGFGDLGSQLQAARARREDAGADEIAEAAPSLSGFMAKLHDAMRRAGAQMASVRDSIIAKVRREAGMLEDENPEAFAAAVLEETRMALRR